MSLSKLVSALSDKYPSAFLEGTRSSEIDSALAIKVKGTDVHTAIRGGDSSSNKDQIDLTAGASFAEGTSPVDDFFPSILRPKHFQQSRHLKITCNVWGECLMESQSNWVEDYVDVVRRELNDGANPALQLRGVDALRRNIKEKDWLIFVHRSGQPSFDAFSLEEELWENSTPSKTKELFVLGKKLERLNVEFSEVAANKPLYKGKNIIFFGPPGTGKSTEVSSLVANSQMFRTQFHPEYSHTDLIGSYKPVVGYEISSKQIIGHDGVAISSPINYFAYVPGPLVLALEKAYLDDNAIFFVIEEINRGDCAAIFGDIFQLLDRDDSGRSQYGITIKPELLTYFKKNNILYDIAGDGKLYLPKNLTLLSTMNTSDQSLFPMDSAFKRRWDWIACSIDFDQLTKFTNGIRPFLDDGQKKYDWIKFLKIINTNIVQDQMEDKQIGPWFIKPEKNGLIPWDSFLNKCLFYLWHDVFKDEQFSDRSPFKSDGAGVFADVQASIKINGLSAGLKEEIISQCLIE
jgi:MoxR-like ATPase